MFQSLFESGSMTPADFLFMMTAALLFGILFAVLACYKNRTTKSFSITLAMLPMAVAVVIALVNGNLGIGVAIAGAFGLVRFRSAPGTAREITAVFIAMAGGLAFGTGYFGYGGIFLLLSGTILLVFDVFSVNKRQGGLERLLKITIPESLDYTEVFDEEMENFTKRHELIKVKSVNMGSMFRLSYLITLKDTFAEKAFLDALRIKNGNLEIVLQNSDFSDSEL